MQEKFSIRYYNGIKKLLNVPFKLIYNPIITGINNLPNKPYILAGNHKSLLDIPLLITMLPEDIHFMAKKELFNLKLLKYIFERMGTFPVDREKASLSTIKESLVILKNNQVLGIFPEGTRNKTNELLLPFKKGISMIATKSNSLIVPFGISGEYKIGKSVSLNIGEAIDIKNIDKNLQTSYLEEKVKELILKK